MSDRKEMLPYELFPAAVFRLYRDVIRIEQRDMEKHGLRGSMAQYLAMLWQFPEGITAARLSEICDKDKAGVSRTVAQMEQLGLLTRQGGSASGYRARLVLTDKGKELAGEIRRRGREALAAAGEGMEGEQWESLCRTLWKIADRLQVLARQGSPRTEEES